MHLTSLEMQGFKSFPEYTVIEFHKGITAIVGPNGSGKSNVTDAIRWVLGEQSARSLRGDKMEDVVFNGTENRRAMGFAEVAINFDNSDQALPLEYNHLRIVRRYYRSGESEYLINQTPCRLKDITALFMDTGIGRDGYSLISQGKVDEVLSSRSEDRRRIFDEASGIVKYKTRKLEAERKLERTDTNLIRINDILDELSDRLPHLQNQAEKARIFLELSNSAKKLDIALILHQLDVRKHEASRQSEARNRLSEDLAAAETEVARVRQDYESTGHSIRELEQCADNLRQKYAQALDELSLKTNNIGLLNEQNKHLTREKTEALSELKRLSRQQELLVAEKETREHKQNVLERQKEAFGKQLSVVEEQFQALLAQMDEQAQAQDHRRQELSSKRENIFAIETDQIRLQSEIELLDRQQNSLKQQIISFESEQAALNRAKTDAQTAYTALEQNISLLSAQRSETDQFLNKKNLEINSLAAEHDNILQQIRDYQYQQSTLTKLEENLEGYQAPVKKIMQKVQSDTDFVPDMIGPLGALIDMSPEFETAIEVALAASANYLVTNTATSAQILIEWLRETDNGRATFLPLETITPRKLSSDLIASAQKNPGYLGLASDLVSFPESIKNVVEYQLGRILVCDTFDHARTMASDIQYGCRIVTLEGDVFHPGGSISGGSIKRSASGIVGRSGRIAELGRRIDHLYNIRPELSQKLDEARAELLVTTAQNDEILAEIQQLSEKLNSQRLKLDGFSETENKLKYELEHLETTLAELSAEKTKLQEQSIAAQEELRNEQETLAALTEKIEQESAKREAARTERDRLREQQTDLKIALGSIEQSLAGIIDFIKHLNEQAVSDELRRSQLKQLVVAAEKQHSNNMLSLEQLSAEVDQVRDGISSSIAEIDEQNTEKALLEDKRLRLFHSIEAQSESLSSIKGELVRLDEALLRIEQSNDVLRNRLWEEYELTEATAQDWKQDIVSYNKSQKEFNQLRSKIRELGTVNVDAIREHESLMDRYDFMTKQRNDIELSRRELTDLIKDLDLAMADQFQHYFTEISINFDSVFRELFGGGYAELSLQDTNEILSTDIIIKAQPPGKRLQNLSLLSGGERSLTAIALLFAILRMKPAPFCVFDEVESTLDDANVLRFTDYIRRYADNTQFILVTHRKGTMEAAERLYGVTMQERGVSSIYSMKLSDYPAD